MTPEKWQEILADRQRAYMLTFGEFAGKTVLDDLAEFCRANQTCVVPGDRDLTWVLEGRREVYLRIRDHLDLHIEQLFDKFTRPAQGAYGHDRTDTPT